MPELKSTTFFERDSFVSKVVKTEAGSSVFYFVGMIDLSLAIGCNATQQVAHILEALCCQVFLGVAGTATGFAVYN